MVHLSSVKNCDYFFQVHNSGLEISFQDPYDDRNPMVIPLSLTRDVFYRSTNDSDTLKHAVGLISALNPSLRMYQPALAVIVTGIVGYQDKV